MAKRELKTNNTPQTDIVSDTVNEVVESVPTTLIGVVSDCSRLNVRKEAKLKSDVITIINANTNVAVDPDKSTKEWYYVTVNGKSGYCMKKYISIKS